MLLRLSPLDILGLPGQRFCCGHLTAQRVAPLAQHLPRLGAPAQASAFERDPGDSRHMKGGECPGAPRTASSRSPPACPLMGCRACSPHSPPRPSSPRHRAVPCAPSTSAPPVCLRNPLRDQGTTGRDVRRPEHEAVTTGKASRPSSTPNPGGRRGDSEAQGGKPPTPGHTARVTPQPPRSPRTPCCVRTCWMGKWIVKELCPHPSWLNPEVPNQGFPGGPHAS